MAIAASAAAIVAGDLAVAAGDRAIVALQLGIDRNGACVEWIDLADVRVM